MLILGLDNMSRPMTSFTYTTSPTYGTSVTVPQRPAVQHQGFKEQSQHPPLVVTELTSEIPPVTLRMENEGKMATQVGVPVKESGARHSQVFGNSGWHPVLEGGAGKREPVLRITLEAFCMLTADLNTEPTHITRHGVDRTSWLCGRYCSKPWGYCIQQ